MQTGKTEIKIFEIQDQIFRVGIPLYYLSLSEGYHREKLIKIFFLMVHIKKNFINKVNTRLDSSEYKVIYLF